MGAAESKDATQSNDYITATDSKATVFVQRSDVTQYQDLVAVLLNHFPNINATSIVIQTNEMDNCTG
ncbi:uncharacterized protein EV420DRAFT_1645039 [Desarmillaria tabescens]|uniref:Uncharacterized protein n=1 Tax=Armillaria tabescens TaxID=1929756 RepID=A0AA39K663_ARMTA|nr:uncharacterized protein EV420DRAFT_1645039 [Desarmillaria tabescens]KAK0454170.1 hypothetical protein EV420DRAFT_1645039 [Desarmillaria tabescens]